MIIFLDTEFTSLNQPELISIGMISDDGKHQLYLEVRDIVKDNCSEFVTTVVIPLLGHGKKVLKADLEAELSAWFESLPENITIACDSDFDKDLLTKIFNGKLPSKVTHWIDLYTMKAHPDYQRTVLKYHAMAGREHHALHDAIAHRRGWLACHDGKVLPKERT
ncbi:3'-5' exoribonuclease [Leeia sp. TBRC 13508]|uniref:3'-5' exoribonuclease n=1 Tax=Leeia speluncae TaxID=2884804 RepID=A0ABS8DA48_9NEIS|nr:3'-5' exoribonuclease [Leeia speluncae]MCB6185080.1 3'-5' exoribonuclease [Leeia speluncae]